jgi:hypothetical protein
MIIKAVDNAGSPTGCVVTITGSGGGTVTVSAMRVDNPPPSNFVAGGSRTGDGTVSLSLEKGFWWVYAATSSSVSNVVQVQVTDGTDSVPVKCRQAIESRIKALQLKKAGGDPLPLYVQFEPDWTGNSYPCIVMSVDNVAETDRGNTTSAKDFIGYPTRITISDSEGGGAVQDHRKMTWLENTRYQVMRAFSNQPLPGIPDVSRCVIEPAPIYSPEAGQYFQRLMTYFTIRCVANVPRGLGV